MSDKVNFKDVVIDKSIKATVKTSKAVTAGAKQSIKHGAEVITNSSKDFYDKLEDMSQDSTKELAADNIYALRNTHRANRSVRNIRKKYKVRKNYIENYSRNDDEDDEDSSKGNDPDNTISDDNVKDNEAEDENDDDDPSEKEDNDDINDLKAEGKKDWKSKSREEKKEIYRKSGIKQGFSIKKSSLKTIRNQSRKALSNLSSKNDISSHVIGTTAKGMWTVIRYRNTVTRLANSFLSIIRNAGSWIKALISLPAMILSLLSSIPLMIVIIICLIIFSILGSWNYSGHITEFVDNEVYLEYRYDANVAPDEILAITDVLGWTDEKKEDYEGLFAILLDGKDSDWNISFDKMIDNIFNKYNPENYIWTDSITVKRENVFGIDYATSLSYEEYLDLFPKYKNLPSDKKGDYGNTDFINQLKSDAHTALEESALKYTNRYIETSSNLFEHNPLNIQDIAKGASTFKVGYRSFMSGAFHGGTDIAATEGTPVYAITDAKVIAVFNSAYASGDICANASSQNIESCGTNYAGNQVVLEKEIIDLRTGTAAYLYIAYFHLQKDSIQVQIGQTVSAGDVLGKTGNTGMSFGGHLHIQSWIDTLSRYQLPYSSLNDAISIWQRTIDATMFCDIEFRNYIYGR